MSSSFYATKTLNELAPLTADLGTGRGDVERQRAAVSAERVAPQVAILSSSMARPTGRVEGRMTALALLGNARIDLAHASLGADGVETTAQAIAGRWTCSAQSPSAAPRRRPATN